MADWDLDTPAEKKTGAPESRPTAALAVPESGGRSPGGSGMPAAPSEGVSPNGPSPVVKPKSRRPLRLLSWVAVGIVFMLAGALMGFFLARSQLAGNSAELAEAQQKLGVVEKALSEAEERNWMYYREAEALKVQLEEAQGNGSTSTSTTTPGAGSARTYGDGIYLVGEDISPGTYDGVVTGEVGYWARLKGTDAIVGSIITNAVLRGPFVLTIVESDKAVELRGVVITGR
jgi:hypothetical protein